MAVSKSAKIWAEMEKVKAKINEQQARLKELEQKHREAENEEIVDIVRGMSVSLDELLYVDDAIADDVAFEAADRAATVDASAEPPVEDGSVHIGFDGIHVEDGKDHVHISWSEGVHVVDRHGQEVHVGWDGVRVNATEPGAVDHIFDRGSSFDDIDSEFAKQWLKFPFWAVVLVVYLLLGIFSGAWWQGLFLLFLIPIYYIVGAAIVSRRVAPLLCGLYPVVATAWFFWMAFIVGSWHPAWAIFLTIPLVEVLIVKVSERWHRRHDTIEVTVE